MKLDFNWKIKNWDDQEIAPANEVIAKILEQGVNQDERYIDKIDDWGRKLIKDKAVEVDQVDAKQIRDMVIKSNIAINIAKSSLKNYIQKRIDETTKK